MLLQIALFNSFYKLVIFFRVCRCMFISLSIHLSMETGCFHILAIVNRATIHIEVHVSLGFFVCFFSLLRACLPTYYIYKAIKDANQHPDEETCRTNSQTRDQISSWIFLN